MSRSRLLKAVDYLISARSRCPWATVFLGRNKQKEHPDLKLLIHYTKYCYVPCGDKTHNNQRSKKQQGDRLNHYAIRAVNNKIITSVNI